tara:strand:- start:3206 stop:5347 length:2142 start_codon:yes stop_codon:yes gene_type:complete
MSVSKNPKETPKRTDAAFVTWNKGSNEPVPLADYQQIQKVSAGRERFKDIDTNISVRDSFSRNDYEYFRPDEAIPKKKKEIISFCMQAYRKVGLIRNVVDLMSDFGSQGVHLVHPNARIQKFFRGWFKKIDGNHVSERFLNMLYRTGNVVTKRSSLKINVKAVKEYQSIADISPDMDLPKGSPVLKRVIPGHYDFLNPMTLEVLGGDLATFAGKQTFGLKIPTALRRKIINPKDDVERQIVAELPKDIVEAAKAGKGMVVLDPDKISAYFYKKDDWQTWADPMIYAILDDLILLEKMRLADLAALDGAISQVRLWRLGSLEHEIFPTDAAVQKLADILMSNPGGGSFDLIWGPELDFKESGTNVHQFLGSTKYEPVLNNIYAGLGVPPTLTGAATASGFTNNYISLKTLVQRLEYGRGLLRSFWEKEIEIVQKAMGFRLPAKVMFDRMVLADESAEKSLLIQLVDRGIISYETIQERFGEIPEVENLRQKRERKSRDNDNMSPQAGPWHNPEKDHELGKIALQKGIVAPSEIGLDLNERKEGESTPQEDMKDMSQRRFPSGKEGGGEPQQGRPKNSNDKEKRKTKEVKPRTSAELKDFSSKSMWAKSAQQSISDIVSPAMLKHFGKKNLRSLSAQQTEQLETLKFSLLCSIDPYVKISPEEIMSCINEPSKISKEFYSLYSSLISDFASKMGNNPSIDELRDIQVLVYSTLKS